MFDPNRFTETFAKTLANKPLRLSDYAILVKSEHSGRYVVAHGYSGFIEEVDKCTFAWLESGLAGSAPSSSMRMSLLKNGVLTFKTEEKEKGFVKSIIGDHFNETRANSRSSVTVILSYDCNFRCTYCTQRHTQLKGQDHLDLAMTDEVMDSAFEFIENSNAPHVTLFGGEPFLPYDNHQRRVRRFFEGVKALGLNVSVVSNGHDWIEYADIFDSGLIRNIQVTIDGPRAVHDLRRVQKQGIGSFDKIMDNIGWGLDRGVAISARINVDYTNIEELQQLTQIFNERKFYFRGDFSAYLAPVQGNGFYKKEKLFGFQEMYLRMMDSHTRSCLTEENNETLFNYDYLPGLRLELEELLSKKTRLRYKFSYCGAYTSLAVLDPFGRIYPCWDFVDNLDHQIGEFHPKVVYNDVVTDLWRGRDREVLQKDCLSCPYVLLHGSGCQAEAYRQTGKYWERDCEDFPFQFDLAVKAALGDVDIRGRDLALPSLDCSSCHCKAGSCD